MDNSTGQIMNSLFRSWNSSTYFDWTYQGSTLSHMKILSGGNWKIGYNINTTDSLYAGQIRGDLSTVGSIHIEPLKKPVISAVISQIGGGAATINYKVVVRTVDADILPLHRQLLLLQTALPILLVLQIEIILRLLHKLMENIMLICIEYQVQERVVIQL